MITGTALRALWTKAVPWLVGAAVVGAIAYGEFKYHQGVQDCAQRAAELALEKQIETNERLQEKAIRDREIAETQVGKLKDIQNERKNIERDEDIPALGCAPSAEWLQYIRSES